MNTKQLLKAMSIGFLLLASRATAGNTENHESSSACQINLIEFDCREGETYCGDGVFEMCKNGEWVVVEDCNAAGKMCDPNGTGCIECIPEEYNSAENALLIEPDTRIAGILCTSTCEQWYKIEVPAGKALFVSINWDGGGGVYLDMYDVTGVKSVGWLNEAMEIGYTNPGEAAIFYLKASNDSANQRFARYSFEAKILDEYIQRDLNNMGH
jgi:hypothetical protein